MLKSRFHNLLTSRRAISSFLYGVCFICSLLMAGASWAQPSPVLFRDDFNAPFSGQNALDPAKWSVYDNTIAYGRTQFGNVPTIANDAGAAFARLKLSNYNYNNDPNFPFKGTEMFSPSFAVGVGKEFEARVRVTDLPSGLIAAFWTYGSRGVYGTPEFRSDEIDIEFLTKQPHNSLLLTNWNEWDPSNPAYGDGIHHSDARVTAAGLDWTQWNTYKIRWLPDRTEWYANNILLRTSAAAHPDDPMGVRFNIWAPATDWQEAYDPALIATTNQSASASYNFDVDWVEVRAVVPTLSLSITPSTFSEAAGATAATATVTRNTDITAPLTVNLSSSNPAGATVINQVTIPAGATFTTVSIAAIDNEIADGTKTANITASASQFVSGTALVTITDNDVAGVAVNAPVGLTTTESGGTVTFTIALTSQPTANVTVPLQSSNPGEGVVSPVALTFTATNWKTPQTVTVTGVDDAFAEGDVAFSIMTGAPVSTDPVYSAFSAAAIADVPVTNKNNDTAGVAVTPSTGLVTTENGGATTFTIALTSQPFSNVSISLASSNTGEGQVSPSFLLFTPLDWNAAQTVRVTGIDEAIVDGNNVYTISSTLTSDDPVYKLIKPANLSITNLDNDIPTLTLSTTASSFSEATVNNAATVTITRNTLVTSALTINLAVNNPGKVSLPVTVTIPAGQSSVSFPIAAIDNDLVNGSQQVTITATASNFSPAGITVTTIENDAPGLSLGVNPSSLDETAGAPAATGTVTRNSDLGVDMTVSLVRSDPNAIAAPFTVVIPGGQLSTTFALSAINDQLAAGPRVVTITAIVADNPGIVDGKGLKATTTVTITDSSTPTLILTTSVNSFSETAGAGAATGTVTRNTPTTEALIISLTSNRGAVTVPTSITIPAGQATVAFPINAINDMVATGAQNVTLTATASGFNSGTTTITVTDDDPPSLSLSINPDRFSEAGGSRAATATVSRNTPTTSSLRINLTSSQTGKARVPATVTIPAGALSISFPVAAVNNAIADGPQRVNIRASAGGFMASEVGVTVLDDEPGGDLSIGGQITVATLTDTGATVRKPLPGVRVRLITGATVRDVVTTDTSGVYRFTNLLAGSYNAVANLDNYVLSPASRVVTLTTTNDNTVNFDATARGQIKGQVTRKLSDGSRQPLGSITVTASYAQGVLRARTDNNGRYVFKDLPLASYRIAPAITGKYFTPRQRTVPLQPATALISDIDFEEAGGDTIAPTVTVSTPRPGTFTQSTQPTVATGMTTDRGGAGVVSVTGALARFSSATASTPSGFYNWSTQAFITSDNAAVVEKLAQGTATWTLRGLPTLPAGFYALRATAVDGAANTTRSSWLRFRITDASATITTSLTTAASSEAISNAAASAATSNIQLRFSGPMNAATASDAVNYVVQVNGRRLEVESAGYDAGNHRVTLSLPEGSLRTGARVVVQWAGLEDDKGESVAGRVEMVVGD